MNKTVGLAVAAVCVAVLGRAEEIRLVDRGVANCRIVVAADAHPAETFAAEELAKYLKVAAGADVLVGKAGGAAAEAAAERDGTYPITVVCRNRDDGMDPWEEDPFEIEVTEKGMTIAGAGPRGTVYGIYEVLKRYAGMRWVTPGEDGEYCILQGKSVVVPCGREVQKPHLKVRVTIGCDSPEGILWHLRNNMDAPLIKFLQKGVKTGGPCGHVMSNLLIGDTGKTRKETLDKLFAEHPEYFPLIDGKRVKINGANDSNPCISNPALLDRMAENMLKAMGAKQESYDYLTIGNNDTTVWCQCDTCKALDAPEAKNTRGELSDRYWYMVSEIAKRVWAKRPEAKLGGWAYQNFWYAPVHVRPDPRLRVLVSFNNQCWRHSACDPTCAVNKEMVKIYDGWKKLGMTVLMNRDEIGTWDGQGGPGCELIPAETVLAKNICEDYAKIGCNGSNFCVPGPFPRFSNFAKKWSPYYGKRYHWYAMWQTCYMSAKFMWDAKTPYASTLEEANRLYYGAGWEGGMKEFRALLADCFFNTPGCIGWGQGTSTGRCLDKPGSEEKLKALLDQALASVGGTRSVASAADTEVGPPVDARALEHIAREKEIFELTWLKERKKYVESYREMTAYKRTGEIAVDGVLDEADWQTADSYSNFQPPSWNRGPGFDPEKTYMKIVYDRDHLYFGIEAMEPFTDRMIAADKVDRFAQRCANLGNHLELFYAYPDMNQACWHMMINSKGQIIDALNRSTTDRDLSIVTKAKWAVKTYPDRWTLEMAIPCTEIGQNILDGMTWRVNCARQREVEGLKRCGSSAAAGLFHGGFVNVKFLAKRSGTGAHDLSSWKNANLNAGLVIAKQYKPERIKGWTTPMMPKHWSLDQNSEASYQAKEGDPNDYYVTLRKGQFNQYYFPQAAGTVKLRLKARGTGSVGLIIGSYVDYDEPGKFGYRMLADPKVAQPSFKLTPEWQEFTTTRKVLGVKSERVSFRFRLGKDSVADLDDIEVYPVEEDTKPADAKGCEGVSLVADGVAKCRVVLAENASNPEKFAARELVKYFKVATGAEVAVQDALYPIVLDCMERKDGLDPWKEDEFEIDVTEKGMTITGYGPRGTLYGVYEVLKEYAGMRWLVPGADGEYCVNTGKTITVPFGKVAKKPHLKIRETRTTGEEGMLWTVRNNMQWDGLGLQRFSDAKGNRTKECDHLEEMCVKGIGPCGHIQSTLLLADLGNNSYNGTKEKAEAAFKRHPEWFPMIDGKRKLVWGANDPNPCVSNEAYLDHAAEVICKWIDRPHGRDSYMTLGNNDTTLWCQCEKCQALDAPEAKGTKGEISDRYWHMVNGIAKRVWKKFPDAKLCGWAYQNYWYPPLREKIDPRLKVFVSFNNQCWRHSCLDPKCTINAEMKKIYALWAKTGLPLVVNRDEIGCGGTPGSEFMPVERVLRQNFLDYREMGCSGSHFCVGGPYPRFLNYAKKWAPYYGANDEWYAMWQTCYMSARLEWDPTRDFEKEWEEANALYYGKTAWEGAMREFRRTLEKAFFETPGCIGWGSGAPMGRCLDQAGMEQKLKGLLDKAVALAKTDPDARALKHVEMEKSIFERTWLKARQVYLDNFKELNVYKRTGAITVDGVLDEADWKNADVLGNFKAAGHSLVKTPDIQQTYARVVYDRDHLYIAVEAMEPEISKMKAGKAVDRQHGYDQLGNHIELFYNFPDMFERCFQIHLNSEGQILELKRNTVSDCDTSFMTQAKWAVKKGTDRWTVEIAIPCTEIGQNCFDGATWKLNVGRQREVEGAKRETSSSCNGLFYAPAMFINMKFTPGRVKGLAQGHDVAPWRNAGFESVKPNPTDKRFTWRKWTSPNVPKEWGDGNYETPGELVEESGNHYLRIHGDPKTDISQYFIGEGKGKLHTTLRARGKGKLVLWTASYTNHPPQSKRGGYAMVGGTSKSNTFDLTPEWKTYAFDTPKLGYPTERVAHRFRLRGDGTTADIDDVYVSPQFE